MFDFLKSKNGKVLDSSVLVDARILGIIKTGFIDSDIIIPSFIINELQALADSDNPEKRKKGRRGLSCLEDIQKLISIEIVDSFSEDIDKTKEVDTKLVFFCKNKNYKLITLDYNLNQVAKIHGVIVLNIDDLFTVLRPQYLLGDKITVKIVKPGQQSGQGIGSMEDGTMVVVDGGEIHLNKKVSAIIRQRIKLASGWMLFAKIIN